MAEISASLKDLNGCSSGNLSHNSRSQFNSPVRSLQKPDGYCRMTTDDHIFSQEVVPTTAVSLVRVSLLEPVNTDLGTWYAANEFFSIASEKRISNNLHSHKMDNDMHL